MIKTVLHFSLLKHFALWSMFCFLGASLHAQDFQNWKYMHPKPQANSLRKIRMLDTGTWVATGANGTFMKTTDAGVSWFFHHTVGAYTDNAQTIGQNYDLTFKDGNNGLVVGWRGYVGKTDNGGVTFTQVGTGLVPTAQRCNAIWFVGADTGYVAAGSPSGFAGTILKTVDGGSNWSSVNNSSSYAFTAVAGVNGQTVCTATMEGAIGRSTNGGGTWTMIDNVFPSPGQPMYGLSFLDSLTGFVCGSSGQISKTTDGGTTWSSPFGPQHDWTMFQIKIKSASEIYAVGAPDTLWKTTDLGATWTGKRIMPVSGPSDTFIWYSLDIRDGVMLLSGDFGVLAKSTDGGLSWSSGSVLMTTQLMFDIENVPSTNSYVAVGRQYFSGSMTKQAMHSSDGGTTWQLVDIPVATDLNGVSMVTSQIGYACGTGSKVVKTTNGGLSWFAVTQPHPTSYTLGSIEFVDTSTGWVFVNFAVPSGGGIFKTTDGGTTWTQQGSTITTSIMSADMVDANTGFVSLNSSGRPIYKTTDGGATWASQTIPMTGLFYGVRAPDTSNVYVISSSGTNRVAKSTDGGATWAALSLPAVIDLRSIDFLDANVGYVAGNAVTAICKTTDGGASWTFQNVHLPTLVKVYVAPDGSAFALGTYATILKWTNVAASFLGSPSSLSFGNVTVGASKLDSVIVQNTGNTTLAISFMGLNNIADFSFLESAPLYVVPGGSVKVHLLFHPTAAGATEARLTFIHNAASSPDTIHLSGTGSSLSVTISSGWNLISNPVSDPVPGDSVLQLFPTSMNPYAFEFSGGYVQRYRLINGKGYWGKFPGATSNTLNGTPLVLDSISVVAGWNIVGTIGSTIDTSTIVSIPPGLKTSNWFGYSAGYTPVAQIVPGKGYWVKASGAGTFIMTAPAAGALPTVNMIVGDALASLNSLTITDRNGGSQTLYFGAAQQTPVLADMPPLPPAGAFDSRFASTEGGTMVKTHPENVNGSLEFAIDVQSDAYPLTITWKLKGGNASYELADMEGQQRFKSVALAGEGSTQITNNAVSTIALRVTGDAGIPREYALAQNYPNPFNPTTEIRYALAGDAHVQLTVFNLLGQRVAMLKDDIQGAGYHSISWTGKNDKGTQVGSGAYFYRIDAQPVNGGASFSNLKKMVFLK
jgi:photosystem II stability/assembly factor-like uncharacterized protein